MFENILKDLQKSNQAFNTSYPGEPATRQPVHTVYGGAHLFSRQLAQKMSEASLKVLKEYAPTGKAWHQLLGQGDLSFWEKIHRRIEFKLKNEAVEDFRIDFEDGYGNRADTEEDGHAKSVATEVAQGFKEQSLPPYIGIRIKPLSHEAAARSLRTLNIFLTTLSKELGSQNSGKFFERFVVTLPKITHTGQAVALRKALETLEKDLDFKTGILKFEIMVETTQAIMNDQGACPLRDFVSAGGGRCMAAHFGTYDYTAGSNITASYQAMNHSVCDFAKHMMKAALTGTGVTLSDGATNVMPIGSVEVVHRAWKLSHSHIRHSLINGFYQGWDLHPAQLPIRYATVFSFFQESLEPTTQRLKLFVEKAARATLLGDVFDDAATGQGLLNFFLRGLSCGAITQDEALATGLSLKEIQSRSFLKILEGRKKS